VPVASRGAQQPGSAEVADCVLGFAFGFRRGPRGRLPGATNAYLGACVDRLPRDARRILQEEIADATQHREHLTSIPSSRPAGDYVDTRTIAVEMAEIVRRENYAHVVVVAHPRHMRRAIRTLARLGVRGRPAGNLEDAPFDPLSAQPWTRGPVRWRIRETVSLLMYRARGWT
jgi:hypothetical protein